MKTIAFINQKGGVGKSTSALATAAGLHLKGYGVLFVDLDAQLNATRNLGADLQAPTSLDVLQGNTGRTEATQSLQGIDVIPASPFAVQADLLLQNAERKAYRLKDALRGARYDYCIIDTPPALNTITTNALTAANYLVIPAQADYYTLEGIAGLAQTIKGIQQTTNPKLQIAGILLTRHNPRTAAGRAMTQALQDAAGALNTRLFNATIREAVAVKEAQIKHRDLYSYAPKAKITGDYRAFIDELLKVVK